MQRSSQAHYSENAENQRQGEHLKEAREKWLGAYKGTLIELIINFLSKTTEASGSEIIYSKCSKKKNCQPKI